MVDNWLERPQAAVKGGSDWGQQGCPVSAATGRIKQGTDSRGKWVAAVADRSGVEGEVLSQHLATYGSPLVARQACERQKETEAEEERASRKASMF